MTISSNRCETDLSHDLALLSSIESAWKKIDDALDELLQFQKAAQLKCGRRIIPYLTADDVLQPNDFLELEFNPHFRYEEGIVAGIQMAKTALQELHRRLST